MRITGTVHTPYKINTSSDTNGLTYRRQKKNLNLFQVKLTKDYEQHEHIYSTVHYIHRQIYFHNTTTGDKTRSPDQ